MARVLLVYANPAVTATPVPPYGAERIAQALRIAGCDVRLVAPWLELHPRAALREAVASWRPDLVGFSVRNVDDALVVRSAEGEGDLDTTPWLPAVRPLVRDVVTAGIPVLIGGAAVATNPLGTIRTLGARHGIAGPADDLAWRLGRALAQGVAFPEALPADPRVIDLAAAPAPRLRGDADAWRPVPGPTPRMGEYLALARAREGRVPVMISAGCDRRCAFCVEASFLGGRVRPRPVDEIVQEIGLLQRAGVRRVWLAASELNVPDARHAVAVLRAVAAARLEVDLQGFLQPAPVDDALLDALETVGVDPAALSWELGHLDDAMLRKGGGPANRAALDRLVALYVRRGYRTLGGSVLLGAMPDETLDHVDAALGRARELDAAFPDGLGLAYAAGARVYPASPLGRWVAANRALARPHLYGRWTRDFVAPLVYCRPMAPRRLLAHVQASLAGCRGAMTPLNAEAPAGRAAIEVERRVNLAIVQVHRGDPESASRLLRAALRRNPDHLEALRQQALVLANGLGEREGALTALVRLAALTRDPVRAAEVAEAIRQLRG